MITANIHRVKSIRLERVDFGGFISHQFTFETDEGEVCISAFAATSLEIPSKSLPAHPECVSDAVVGAGA